MTNEEINEKEVARQSYEQWIKKCENKLGERPTPDFPLSNPTGTRVNNFMSPGIVTRNP